MGKKLFRETLYAKTKTNTIKWYRISIEDNGDGTFTIHRERASKLDGKPQNDPILIEEGKQKRSVKEQAEFQAASIYKSKMDSGYKPEMPDEKTTHNTDSSGRMKPMKISYYEEGMEDKFAYPIWVQPKKDGVFALFDNFGEICSINGLKFDADLSHLTEEIVSLKLPKGKYTGELYLHGEHFEDIVGAVKKTRELTGKLELWVFDRPDGLLTQAERLEFLREKFPDDGSKYVKRMPTFVVNSFAEIEKFEEMFVDEDEMEGIVIRQDNFYNFGNRSRKILKWVREFDSEYEIVDYKEATGRDAGTPVFVCKTEEGKEFDVRPMGTLEHRKKLFKDADDLIGEMMTVRYRNLTKRGVPRFPVGKHVRDYE